MARIPLPIDDEPGLLNVSWRTWLSTLPPATRVALRRGARTAGCVSDKRIATGNLARIWGRHSSGRRTKYMEGRP